jgi:hypothetical protein
MGELHIHLDEMGKPVLETVSSNPWYDLLKCKNVNGTENTLMEFHWRFA